MSVLSMPTGSPDPTTERPMKRWLIPLVVALAVLGGGAAIGALTAAADSGQQPRNAQQLLVDLQSAKIDGLSGTVVQRSDLGLPPLGGGSGSADLTSLLSGTHTLRVWYSGPDKARVALMGTEGETDVITNGTDLWVWSSAENKAVHTKFPSGAGRSVAPSPSAAMPDFTPQELASMVLKLLGTSSTVTTEGSVTVAGRDAEELVVAPKDTSSLVGSIRIAVDSAENIPLRVQVFARSGGEPAIEVGFTQVSFTRPADDQFTFNPPPGVKVEERSAADFEGKLDHGKPSAEGKPSTKGEPDDKPKMAVIGTPGWTMVLVTVAPTGDRAATLKTFVEQFPKVSGDWGSGHLATSKLLNVLVTDDGRILVGAVRPDKLYAAAADPKADLTK